MLQWLITHYGYPIVTIGTFLEGETVLILGGVSAHLGYLSLGWVITCGFVGTLCGDQLYFILGRRHGNALLARHPTWQARIQGVMGKLERHQNLLILGFRFLYGLRTITPFAMGMSSVSWLRFALLNLIGAGIWAIGIGLAGYYFGRAVEAMLGDIKHYELELVAAIIGVAALVWLAHLYRRRGASRDAS